MFIDSLVYVFEMQNYVALIEKKMKKVLFKTLECVHFATK